MPDAQFLIVGANLPATCKGSVTNRGDRYRPRRVDRRVPRTRPGGGRPAANCPGIQNKVLEAMAMALPVVVSKGAMTGISATSGVQLICADAPQQWIDACVSLARNPGEARRIGQAARKLMLDVYNWEAQFASSTDARLGRQRKLIDRPRDQSQFFSSRADPAVPSQNRLDNTRRGKSGTRSISATFSAVRFHHIAAHDVVQRVIGAFDQNIRFQGAKQIHRRVFVEQDDIVHRFQRSQNMRALPFGDDRRLSPLLRRIEASLLRPTISLSPELWTFEQRDVSDMRMSKKPLVKTMVCFGRGRREECGQFLACENFP